MKLMDAKTNDLFTPPLKEAPFYYEGISFEEYDVEREYYHIHFVDLVQKGLYEPLWKQKQKKAEPLVIPKEIV